VSVPAFFRYLSVFIITERKVLELKYGSQHLVDEQKTTDIIVSSYVTNNYQKPNIENQ
jgi:hypothetical protein